MSSTEVIHSKIGTIKKYLSLLAGFRSYSEEKIKNDTTLSGAVERYAYLATQATIDLAEAFVSYKNYRKPNSMSEAFQILSENKIISQGLNDKMTKMVGFRNILAHDYEDLDFKILYSVVTEKVTDVEAFIEAIENRL